MTFSEMVYTRPDLEEIKNLAFKNRIRFQCPGTDLRIS